MLTPYIELVKPKHFGSLSYLKHFGNLLRSWWVRGVSLTPFHNLLLKCSSKSVRTVQVNVKELTCIPCVEHLELVLMIVLVLQSFLAALDSTDFFQLYLQV